MNSATYALLGFVAGVAVGVPLLSRRIREFRLSRAGLDNLAQMTDSDMVQHMARLLGALGYRVYRPTWEDAGFDLVLIDGLGQKRGVWISHWRSPVDEDVLQRVLEAAERLESTAPMIVTVAYYTFKAREAARTGAILWTLRDLTQAIGRVKQAAVAYPEIPAIRSAAMTGAQAAGEAGEPARPLTAATGPLATITEPLPVRPGSGARRGRQAEPEPWPESLVDDDVAEPAPREKGKARRGTSRKHTAEHRQEDEVPRCPRCGLKMVVKRSGQGDYWGCPSFPRCLGSRPKF